MLINQWKIERDHFYAELFARFGFDFIEQSGFFFDADLINKDIDDSLDLLCTPLNFQITDGEKSCVLLSTGSFCPIHFGHIDMMNNAKIALEKQGWKVLIGYISPGHDEYINNKCQQQSISVDRRIQLIQEAIEQHNWLAVDVWESIFNKVAVNFTDVIVRLQAYIQRHLKKSIPVFYVCGADNARFAQTFLLKGHCVVVNRPGYEKEFLEYQSLASDNILFVNGDAAVSSSDMRDKKDYFVPDKLKLDLIRQSHPLEDSLVSLLNPYYSTIVSHNFNKTNIFEKNLDKDPLAISLDESINANFSLAISRLYDLDGSRFISFVSRPGYPAVEKQLNSIPHGEYQLWDTDAYSGKTLDYIVDLLQKSGISITSCHTLLEQNKNEILDAKDFFLDADNAGLVIALPNGEITRAPYMFPYVNPALRCSIINALQFSIAIWKLNADYFKDKDFTLGQLVTNKSLFLYMGFKEQDQLSSIADWHYQKLLSF